MIDFTDSYIHLKDPSKRYWCVGWWPRWHDKASLFAWAWCSIQSWMSIWAEWNLCKFPIKLVVPIWFQGIPLLALEIPKLFWICLGNLIIFLATLSMFFHLVSVESNSEARPASFCIRVMPPFTYLSLFWLICLLPWNNSIWLSSLM